MSHNFKAAIRTNIHVAYLPFLCCVHSCYTTGLCSEGILSSKISIFKTLEAVQYSRRTADIGTVVIASLCLCVCVCSVLTLNIPHDLD
jgi:hypothetical protein